MKTFWGLLGVVVIVFVLDDPGNAYWPTGQRWSSGSSIVMQLQLGSSGGALLDGSPDWNSVAESALSIWNPFLNGVSFAVVRDSTAGVALGNSVNNVIWGNDVYGVPFGPGVLAITETLYRPSDNVITETDVVFNRSFTWNSYRGALRGASSGGTLNDLRRVALHEFGHVIGLDHPDDHGQSVVAIMNAHISDIDTLQLDDTNGAAAIYGAPRPGDTLVAGTRLLPGQSITSSNARYRLLYQTDGNLVLFDDSTHVAVWSSGTGGTTAGQAAMQGDGNFVIYDASGIPQWSTGTAGNPSARLAVQSDGNVVVYRVDGTPLWDRLSSGGSTPVPTPVPTPTPNPTPAPSPSPSPGPSPTPAPNPSGAALSSLSLSESTVKSQAQLTGTVTLTGPASNGGATVTLTTSDSSIAQVPPTVTVPSGASSTTFVINASTVSASSTVTLTVIYLGVRTGATLTVTPRSTTPAPSPIPTPAPSPSTSSLHFQGTDTFRASGTSVNITIQKIANTSSTYTSGSLRIDLWATQSVYSGGNLSGYLTASVRTGSVSGLQDRLAPNSTFSNINVNLTYTAPPAGYSNYSLVLSEFGNSDVCSSADHFCIVDYVNLR